MYVVKQFKSKPSSHAEYYDKWIGIHITRKEAESLIVSLAAQLANNNPNTGRVETRWTDSDEEGAAAKGYLTIFVQDKFICGTCGSKFEPYTGTRYPHRESDVIICPDCKKKVCEYCKHIIHTKGCPGPEIKKNKRIWSPRRKK